MSGIIIAIGGGRMCAKETLTIDKYIVGKVKKHRPRALFIPTANKDNSEYCESFKSIYGDLLGCEVDYLLLLRDKRRLTKNKIKDKIDKADIIYVSGGNTLYMMKIWRKTGLDKLLKNACIKDKILAGISAGSICWFKGGFSDSFSNEYIIVRGIGLIDGYNCPHYNNKKNRSSFLARLNTKAKEKKWYSLEDNTALVFYEDHFVIIKSDHDANGYLSILQGRNMYLTERLKKKVKYFLE